MNETIISWSFQNWLTVILMALLFFALLVILKKVADKVRNKSSAAPA